MADCMKFPDTVEEFMEQYKVTNSKQVYTNGTELVPIFRMKQWFEHQSSADVVPLVHGEWLPTNDENKKRCNKCDTVVLIAMYPNGNANFCPNCGAIMDAERMQGGAG